MAKQEQKYEDDDGRVICSMDVEGMPWHDRRVRREEFQSRAGLQTEPMTQAEAWHFTWHAVLAALTIILVMGATWVLFILFCLYVWFR